MSRRRSKLKDLPRSFSDSCLAKRRQEDDEDEFKNPSSSAPQSCSGSSGSDEDEDEGSGETEDMDHYDPSVNSTFNRRPVSSVGRAPVCWAGGREFRRNPAGPTLSVLK